MNVRQIRQRKDGRYEFTIQIGHGMMPVGYCAPFREWWNDKRIPANPDTVEREKATAHKHHTDGHATPQEAAECYKTYLLDHRLNLMEINPDTMHMCQICGEWTQHYATVDTYTRFRLCEKHNTREFVEKLFDVSPDSQIWES